MLVKSGNNDTYVKELFSESNELDEEHSAELLCPVSLSVLLGCASVRAWPPAAVLPQRVLLCGAAVSCLVTSPGEPRSCQGGAAVELDH